MDPNSWAKLRGLIEGALDVPSEGRDEFLRSHCGDDDDLLKQAAEFLRYEDEQESSLPGVRHGAPESGEEPGSDAWKSFLETLAKRGANDERYEAQGELGRGGMGIVTKVVDRDLRRTLAMKVLRGDNTGAHDSRSAADSVSLGRFLEEAQVTSQLDHPGIPPVHELGVDADGHVYFTMKLVKGAELRDVLTHVKEKTGEWTSTRALHSILRACEAVAYAHAKGVIHRDLKPSNIMVGRFGETYVMDWGLARVQGQSDPERPKEVDVGASVSIVASDRAELKDQDTGSAISTMDGDVVGTPIYMAPEQASGHQIEIGPAVDVYAMGAILYQLLTNELPYIPPDTKPSPHTVLRWVMEGPPRPVVELNSAVPPELIAICEKAMNRDPAERYPSMGGLADDLRSYVERRVVKAYATGPVAELKKWVSRNKAAAIAIVVGVLFVVGAGFFTAWQQRKNAEIVAKERDAARAVAEFQSEVLTIDPWEVGPDATPLDVVDRAAERARVAFDADSEIGATILFAIGETYDSFGAYRQAVEQFEACLAARLKSFESDGPEVVEARHSLANAYLELGKLDEAAELNRAVLASRRARHGESHEETSAARLDLARVMVSLRRTDEAATIQREVVEARTAALGPDHEETMAARLELADSLSSQRFDDEAEQIYEDVLGVDGLPEKVRLEARSGLASLMALTDRKEESLAIKREVYEIYRVRLGELHPDTLESRNGLANILFSLGRYDEVLEMDRQVLARRREVLGETHPDVFQSMANEAYDLVLLEKTDEGLAQARAAVDGCRAVHGMAHPATIDVSQILARVLREAGQLDEATSIARQLVDLVRESMGNEHPETLDVTAALAGYLFKKRVDEAYEEAASLWRRVAKVRRARYGAAHPETMEATEELANTLANLGRYEEVLPLDVERLALLEEKYGEEHPKAVGARTTLALSEQRLGMFDVAEKRLRRILAWHSEHRGAGSASALVAMGRVGDLLEKAKRYEEAKVVREEHLAGCEATHGAAAEETVAAVEKLSDALKDLKEYEEALRLDRRSYEHKLRELGPKDEKTEYAKRVLAVTVSRNDRFDEAEELYLELEAEVADELLWSVRSSYYNVLEFQRRYSESIPLRQKELERLRRVKGAADKEAIEALADLGSALLEVEAWEELAVADRAFLELALADEKASDDRIASARRNLASSLRHCERLDDAEKELDAVLALGFASAHAELLRVKTERARIRVDQDRLADAEQLLRAVLATPRSDEDGLQGAVRSARLELSRVLVRADKAAEAEPMIAAAIANSEKPSAVMLLRHAQALDALDRHDVSEARYLESLDALGRTNLKTRRAIWTALAALYEKTARPDEAARYRSLLGE